MKTTEHSNINEDLHDKAVKHVRQTYCERYLSTPYLFLADVAKLIEITTGKETDWHTLINNTNK